MENSIFKSLPQKS